MSAYDENGEKLETASILRKKFEALRMHEEQQNQTPPPIKAQFRPKRFKVIIIKIFQDFRFCSKLLYLNRFRLK